MKLLTEWRERDRSKHNESTNQILVVVDQNVQCSNVQRSFNSQPC